MLRFKAFVGGLSLCLCLSCVAAIAAAAAAEPIFTPRAPLTALPPAGKTDPAALPPPRAPAPPNPVNANGLGTAPAQIIITPAPVPPPLAQQARPAAPAPKSPPPAAPVVLKETLVRGAAVKPSPPLTPARPAPAPAAAAPIADAPLRRAPLRRAPVADFSAWEKTCLLPENLPPLKNPVKIGKPAQARTEVFIRQRPSCAAPILDVLATGETVQVEGKSNGWWRVRNGQWGVFWVGERLLAPMQQR